MYKVEENKGGNLYFGRIQLKKGTRKLIFSYIKDKGKCI